jgi:hypothetical protein
MNTLLQGAFVANLSVILPVDAKLRIFINGQDNAICDVFH